MSTRKETVYHIPVLLNESIDLLVTDAKGWYIDGTLGGGGHSEEILKRLNKKGKLFSFDKDEEAVEYSKTRFSKELAKGKDSRLTLFNRDFSRASSIEELRGKLSGILLDLGVSSRQLDMSRRGFSYRVNSRLDMRFGSHSSPTSVDDILHAASQEELERMLRNYGEEPFARQIARRIVQMRRLIPLKTSFELRQIIEESVPRTALNKSLSRVFQAFRIVANRELDTLNDTLRTIAPHLSQGGRIVIISYHSLEDRIVKNFFKERQKKEQSQSTSSITMPRMQILTPKPISPSESEIEKNPRARSAKMRAAERI